MAFTSVPSTEWQTRWREIARQEDGAVWAALVRKWTTAQKTARDEGARQQRRAQGATEGRRVAAAE
eukprot:9152446-Pyramimonas_sp.AAC.1